MPELPEVENMRRSLESAVKGQTITDVRIRWGKIVSGRGSARKASAKAIRKFKEGVHGRKILTINRRGKNVILILDDGGRVVVHPKMTGRFILYKGRNKFRPAEHDHVIFNLSGGNLIYNDPRKFGYVLFFPDTKTAGDFFSRLGVEPFSTQFTSTYLVKALSQKRGRIKTVLVNQSLVAGLGNIYCDEALFLAGVKPTRPGTSLKPNEISKLHRAIRSVLKKAISLGGSTVLSYRTMEGQPGRFAGMIKVYGRAGEKCFRCRRRLVGIRINNRTTVYCQKCQR
jgi:formamidopyrimidine-DNA glycosylase